MTSSVSWLMFKHSNDFVHRLFVVDHAQTTNRASGDEQVAMTKDRVGDYANIERVTVTDNTSASGALSATLSHQFSTIGLWDKAIEIGAT